MSDTFKVRRKREPFALVSPDVIRDPTLSPTARLLYAVLCTYANVSGTAWPSAKTVLEGLGLGEATRKRAQNELVSAGVLEVSQQFDDRGRQRVNVYTLVDISGRGSQASPPEGPSGEPPEGSADEPPRGSQTSPLEGLTDEPPRTFIGTERVRACVHGRPWHQCSTCSTAEQNAGVAALKCEHNHSPSVCPYCPGGKLAHLETRTS